MDRKNKTSIYEMDPEVKKRLINQYFIELQNSIFYATFATIFYSKSMPGFGHFFKVQSEEENEHAKRILDMILERKISISDKDPNNLNRDLKISSDPLTAIKLSLLQERKNSRSINELMQVVTERDDFFLQNELMWFVKEQREEETLFENILKKFELLKNSEDRIFLIDKDLKKRKRKEKKKKD